MADLKQSIARAGRLRLASQVALGVVGARELGTVRLAGHRGRIVV